MAKYSEEFKFKIVNEHLDRGIQWINYCLALVVGGFIVLLIYPGSSLDAFSIELIIFYMVAGLSFLHSTKMGGNKG